MPKAVQYAEAQLQKVHTDYKAVRSQQFGRLQRLTYTYEAAGASL